MPKTGPKLGSRNATIVFFPILFMPSAKPTEVVVLPSPAVVGVMAVTKTNFASFLLFNLSMTANGTLALKCP